MVCKILASTFVVALFFVQLAEARVKRLSLTDIRDQADRVVVGVVSGVSPRVGPQRKMVWTDYEIQVEEVLLGNTDDETVTISFAGGEAGGLSIGVTGVPRLVNGNRYVLFLLPDNNFVSATIGWGQGVYELKDVELDGEKLAVLISYDGEPLELSPQNELLRSQVVAVDGDRLQLRPGGQSRRELRASEPKILDADGNPVVQPAPVPVSPPLPLNQRQFASLGDLRLFVSGDLSEAQDEEQ